MNQGRTYPEIAALLHLPEGTLRRKLGSYNKTATKPILPKVEDMGHYKKHFFSPAQVEQVKQALADTKARGKWARGKEKSNGSPEA